MSRDAKTLADDWFSDQPPLVEPTDRQREMLLELLHDERFGLLWGLLYAENLGRHTMLSNLRLWDEQQRGEASVLQGMIKGVERVKLSLLELLPDSPPIEETGK